MNIGVKRAFEKIIGAAIEVHRQLGPGLLESAYQRCLCHELSLQGINFECERALPVMYKGLALDCGYRLDLLVVGQVVVKIKAVEKIERIHEAQLLTYLRLGKWQLGLIINFNVAVLKDGIKRRVNDFKGYPLRSPRLRGEYPPCPKKPPANAKRPNAKNALSGSSRSRISSCL